MNNINFIKFKNQFYKYPITNCLIIISVLVYLITFVLFGEEMNVEQALSFGAYNPLYVEYYHEYFRLMTANFIHFGIFHLLINSYSLYGIGKLIETVFKKYEYIIILIISALFTNGIPYLLYLFNGFESFTISGGISGVVFGLIGSLGALAVYYKGVFKDIFMSLALNIGLMLLISFIVPSISWSGHVFGLLGGFVSSLILLFMKKNHEFYMFH